MLCVTAVPLRCRQGVAAAHGAGGPGALRPEEGLQAALDSGVPARRQGVPLRVELGPKDLEKGSVLTARRDTGAKEVVPWAELPARVPALLEQIQARARPKPPRLWGTDLQAVHPAAATPEGRRARARVASLEQDMPAHTRWQPARCRRLPGAAARPGSRRAAPLRVSRHARSAPSPHASRSGRQQRRVEFATVVPVARGGRRTCSQRPARSSMRAARRPGTGTSSPPRWTGATWCWRPGAPRAHRDVPRRQGGARAWCM